MEKYQFGYGCMRLPVTNADDPASFDYPLIEKLFDTYMIRDLLILTRHIHIMDITVRKQ